MKTRIALLAAAAALTIGLAPAVAQQAAPRAGDVPPSKPGDAPPPRVGSSMTRNLPKVDESKMPKELFVLAPVSKAYQPKKTAWGDPDLRGMFPIDAIGGLSIQRTPEQGKRVWLSDEEYKAIQSNIDKFKTAAAEETKANRLGQGNWVEMTGAGRRTSMLIDPDNGRLPDMTDYGKKMQAIGRSSWVPNQTFDWVTDFDSWDRCVTRGFPASMLPFRYNNGVQILQSPGYVVINLEMIHDARIIPLDGRGAPPKSISSWMGESRGHWEGNTLVVETANIRPGAAPLNAATIGGPAPAWNTVPMSPEAKVTERFTLINANTMTYEMTYLGSEGLDQALHPARRLAAQPEVRVLRIRLPRGRRAGAQLHRRQPRPAGQGRLGPGQCGRAEQPPCRALAGEPQRRDPAGSAAATGRGVAAAAAVGRRLRITGGVWGVFDPGRFRKPRLVKLGRAHRGGRIAACCWRSWPSCSRRRPPSPTPPRSATSTSTCTTAWPTAR